MTTAPATFWRPCLWCRMYRPGEAPYLVAVQVQHSDGICPDCLATMRQQIRAKAAVLANERAVEPYLLRWREGRTAAPDAVTDSGWRESSPGRLRCLIRDNWATLLLVGIVLALSAWQTFGIGR